MPEASARAGLFLNSALNVLTYTAFFGARLILPLFALELGAPAYGVGLLAALLWVFPLLLSWPVGKLADRRGPHGLLMLGFAFGIGAALVPFLFSGMPALYCSALLFGVSIALSNGVQQGVLAQLSTPETRPRNIANYALWGGTTTFTGPLLAGFAIDHSGHALASLYLVSLPLFGAVMLLRWGRWLPGPQATPASASVEPRAALRPEIWRVMWISGLLQLGQDMFQFFIPIYAHSLGLSASTSGSALALLSAASFAVRTVLMQLVARFGERKLLAGAMIVEAVCFAAVPFTGQTGPLMAACFLFGLGAGCAGPLTLLLTFSRAPEGRMSETVGLRLTINNLVKLIGPAVFGAVASAFGLPWVFGMNALLMLYAGVLTRTPRRSQAS